MNDGRRLGPQYVGELTLSDFHEAEVMTVPRSDGIVRGIFIPFDANGLYCDRRGKTTCYIRIVPKKENMLKETHLMQVAVPKKRLEEMDRYGYAPPIIGHFRKREKKIVTLDIDEILKR